MQVSLGSAPVGVVVSALEAHFAPYYVRGREAEREAWYRQTQ